MAQIAVDSEKYSRIPLKRRGEIIQEALDWQENTGGHFWQTDLIAALDVLGYFRDKPDPVVELLRRMVDFGCDDDHFCRYCSEWLGPPPEHKPDCPYVVAKAFLESHQ